MASAPGSFPLRLPLKMDWHEITLPSQGWFWLVMSPSNSEQSRTAGAIPFAVSSNQIITYYGVKKKEDLIRIRKRYKSSHVKLIPTANIFKINKRKKVFKTY